MNTVSGRFSYDQLHYLGSSYLQTHPDWLAALGRLHGMQPAPVERCRVLELGCGQGYNLLPMAYGLPESTFHGIDLAAAPLAEGRASAEALGLRNVRLEVCNLLDFPADAGQYDYLIAQGVYSWVPPDVRDRVMAICATHLAPQGIAFISFNAYPGYHFRDLHRQMMLYHLAHVETTDPAEQVNEALGVLEFMARCQKEDATYQEVLRKGFEDYADQIATKGAAGLAWFHHDLLAETNTPVYFHEFADHARRHGLRFVGDATLRVPRLLDLAPEARELLATLRNDPVRQEQYLDFLLGIPFRQVMLCREGATIGPKLGPDTMQPLYVAGNFQPETGGSAVEEGGQAGSAAFASPAGRLVVDHPDARETLRRIGAAWPGAVSFAELAAHQSETGTPGKLAEFLLRLGMGKFVLFRTRASASALEVSERPEASAVARWQAQTGPRVANLYHEMVRLGAASRHLLGLLDGTRDRRELVEGMRAWIASGQAEEDARLTAADPTIPPEEANAPLPTLANLEADVEANLRVLVNLGLLVR